jgi:hypothetical protein
VTLKTFPPAAAIVAFLLAAIGLLAALQHPVLAFFALVPLLAGIGILRKRVWGAYGFALFKLAQLAVLPLIFSRADAMPTSQRVFTIGLNIVLVLLFFLAGRSLAASGAPRGLIVPWIAAVCLFTLPLFFVRAFVIPSAGMEDTLLIGDHILTRVFPRVQPARGDIVVFHYPIDRRQTFAKRVIGLPGTASGSRRKPSIATAQLFPNPMPHTNSTHLAKIEVTFQAILPPSPGCPIRARRWPSKTCSAITS